MLNVLKAGTSYTPSAQVFTCNGDGCYADKCKIRLATYLLKMDDFTDILPASEGHFTTANTLTLKHCDAIFTVFRHGENARASQCFDNSFISFKSNVDGKFYPREDNQTYNDVRFLNLTMDALNVNNSLITSLGKDLRTSLQPFTHFTTSDADGSTMTPKEYWSLGDYNNFIIGIPFCDSKDFMGEISTKGTVQIKLSGDRKKPLATSDVLEYRATVNCFEDALLKIRAFKLN